MISVVIPVYNGFQGVPKSVLEAGTEKEILLVNDGSTDNSAEICREWEKKYPEIRLIDKPHSGVSDTRNAGIRAAKGKYILFLDADDDLSPGSVEALEKFFDSCEDAVDLITYPLETRYHGWVLAPHFRYETLTYSGVYDLDTLPYIGQTTMNIMVKNRGKDNVLFRTEMTFEEDQQYCCDVLKRKMKMGFCKDATYIYYRSETSSSGKLNGACYIFEQAMKMFEGIFDGYPYPQKVPAVFQGLYLNDLAWKLSSNILYPYHYKGRQFEEANERIRRMLRRVDTDVIWNHPKIDHFHKFYWLSQKPDHGIRAFFQSQCYGIAEGDRVLFKASSMPLLMTRIRKDGDTLLFRGHLKSGVFSFCGVPKLFAVNGGKRIPVELYPSSRSYHLSHTEVCRFHAFCLELPAAQLAGLRFEMEMNGCRYPCQVDFIRRCAFSRQYGIYGAVMGDMALEFQPQTNTFVRSSRTIWEILEANTQNPMIPLPLVPVRRKAAKLRKKKHIHLYYDCRGVEKDNAYYRFLADFEKKDGIERYYITDPDNKSYGTLFKVKHKSHLIPFGSKMHKIYAIAAEKIITAFIEDNNILPYDMMEFPYLSDFFGFEVEYLQHGVLHASVPWKYTPEGVLADKLCISTEYERRLFTEKYHFRNEDLIEQPMERWRTLDRTAAPKKRILFAPSWRAYLVGSNIGGVWQPMPDFFRQSDYYQGIRAFLESPVLHEWLEKNEYTLDFKLHPIFAKVYGKEFQFSGKRIRSVDKVDALEEYEIFITDFSSFAFDFLYLGRKVFSYIPDEQQFRCGMNVYREIEPESEACFQHIRSAEEFCTLADGEKESCDSLGFLDFSKE